MDNNQTPDKGTEEDKNEIESKENLDEDGASKEKAQDLEQSKSEDYKKKFSESSRENQILRDRVRITEEKLGKIVKAEIPAEEELKKIHPEWDDLSDFERKTATDNVILRRQLNKLDQDFSGLRDEKQWETTLDNFLDRAKLLDEYPELENKQKEFKEFAKMPTHKGASIDVLAQAFLFKNKEAPVVVKKSSVLERGSGGEKIDSAPKKKLSPDELKNIRLNDPKKYKEILTQHPDWIPSDIEE